MMNVYTKVYIARYSESIHTTISTGDGWKLMGVGW